MLGNLKTEAAGISGLVLAYAAMPGEFDVLQALQFPLYLPRTGANRQMEFLKTQSIASLLPGRFGIMEPGPENPVLPRELGPEDFVIVPTLAVNKERFRLGKGGGYYDRQRSMLQAAVKAAVIPFELTRMPFESLEYDMQIDLVITERGVLK